MVGFLSRLALLLFALIFALSGPSVAANPIGDFFKRVGRSISHLGKTPTPTPTPRRSGGSGRKEEAMAGKDAQQPSPTTTTTPSPSPVEIRPATSAPLDRRRSRDLPYGVAVPNRPGLVTSPYAPDQGFVDVRAFPSSTEVMDPFTGKVFLTP